MAHYLGVSPTAVPGRKYSRTWHRPHSVKSSVESERTGGRVGYVSVWGVFRVKPKTGLRVIRQDQFQGQDFVEGEAGRARLQSRGQCDTEELMLESVTSFT